MLPTANNRGVLRSPGEAVRWPARVPEASEGMSTRITSGAMACTRGSGARSPRPDSWEPSGTVRPRWCIYQHLHTARCSLSVAMILPKALPCTENYFPVAGFFRRNCLASENGCGFWATRSLRARRHLRTVHRTMSSALVFCALLLLKKIAQDGRSPSPGICSQYGNAIVMRPAITKL